MKKYILVLDSGTTNIKAMLINKEGEMIGLQKRPVTYIVDKPGQVEQNPIEIKETSIKVIKDLLRQHNIRAEHIASMGITTQRASFLFWNKKTGEPVSNIITWQDKRASVYAQKKSSLLWLRIVRMICSFITLFIKFTPLILLSILKFDTVHTSVRTGFYLENNPDLYKKVINKNTDILWGTIDSWLLWNLSDQRLHATDYSSASSSGLLDPFTLKWNKTVLQIFKIPPHILPVIKETGADYGVTTMFGEPVQISCLFADQQASLLGQGCVKRGDIKCTNGTGSFVDINTGFKPYASRRKLYPLVAWSYKDKTIYMLEGQSQNTGDIIDWIQNELKLIADPADTETMALSVESTNGVYFLPAFTTGLTFPYWDSSTRGNIFGLSLKTTKAHIIRAVLEGICFRIKDIVNGLQKDIKIPVKSIKLDGGASNNKFILQFLSDILGVPVEHSNYQEATAFGTAVMAGIACGFWQSIDQTPLLTKQNIFYYPQSDEKTRAQLYGFWRNVIKRSLNYRNI